MSFMRRNVGAYVGGVHRVALVLVVCAGVLSACNGGGGRRDAHTLVVSSYPVQYLVRRIAGEAADVHNLTRPGVEPHDVELTSDDIDAIDDAQWVFYIGSGFQPAIAAAAKRRGGKVLDIADGLLTRKGDPHFWLDPQLMKQAAGKVAAALERPEASLVRELDELDGDMRAGLAHCARHEIVTTHESFGYLAARYGLTELSLSGNAPDSEPSPGRFADLSATIKRNGITTVFYEPRVPRAAANALAKDAGVTTALLDPYETTAADYFTVMRQNLAALRTALGCS
jgi:zinc transport system substrate-binding protein